MRDRKLVVCWIIIAIFIGLIGAGQSSLLNYDDVAYMQNYLLEKHKFGGEGVLSSVIAILSTGLNADVLADSGDLRTYC